MLFEWKDMLNTICDYMEHLLLSWLCDRYTYVIDIHIFLEMRTYILTIQKEFATGKWCDLCHKLNNSNFICVFECLLGLKMGCQAIKFQSSVLLPSQHATHFHPVHNKTQLVKGWKIIHNSQHMLRLETQAIAKNLVSSSETTSCRWQPSTVPMQL
jgi:hypothetical protein